MEALECRPKARAMHSPADHRRIFSGPSKLCPLLHTACARCHLPDYHHSPTTSRSIIVPPHLRHHLRRTVISSSKTIYSELDRYQQSRTTDHDSSRTTEGELEHTTDTYYNPHISNHGSVIKNAGCCARHGRWIWRTCTGKESSFHVKTTT
jgi:hypothetical protein